nr:hypothetical protein CJLB15_00103 [Campylobacter phage CJLB-15]
MYDKVVLIISLNHNVEVRNVIELRCFAVILDC